MFGTSLTHESQRNKYIKKRGEASKHASKRPGVASGRWAASDHQGRPSPTQIKVLQRHQAGSPTRERPGLKSGSAKSLLYTVVFLFLFSNNCLNID
jgi:hypothetical protein